MDAAPAIAELVGVDAVEGEAAVAILEGGDAVVETLEEQVDGLAPELRGVEAVEEDRPPTALGVADFADEDGGVGALVAALAGEEGIADPLDQEPFDRFGRAGVLDVAGRVLARGDRAEDLAVLVPDPFRKRRGPRVSGCRGWRGHGRRGGPGSKATSGDEDDVGLPVGRSPGRSCHSRAP